MSSQINSQRVLDALVDITQQRNQDSLELSLIKTISRYIDIEKLVFFRVPPGKKHKVMLRTIHFQRNEVVEPHGIGQYRVVPVHKQAMETINNASVLQFYDQAALAISCFPIVVDATVIGLLEVSNQRMLTIDDQRFICGVLEIYANFVAIIRDNEYDALTGLYNRKTFDEKINRILSYYNEYERGFMQSHEEGKRAIEEGTHWLGVVDIDHFKRINDNFGHLYGDEVLLLLSNVMRSVFREDDLLFRYGGEEFVVVLTPCSVDDAAKTFERFRVAVEKHHFPQVGNITVSIGMVAFGDHDFPQDVVEQADRSLYYAKNHGRNRVCSYEVLVQQGELQDSSRNNDIELF